MISQSTSWFHHDSFQSLNIKVVFQYHWVVNCDFIPQDENIDKHAKVPERTLKGNTPRVHASVPSCASSEHSEKMDYFFWPHQNIFQFKLFWTKPQWIINKKKNQDVITFLYNIKS